MKYLVIYYWEHDDRKYKAIFETSYDAKLFGQTLERDSTTIKDVKSLHIEYREVQ